MNERKKPPIKIGESQEEIMNPLFDLEEGVEKSPSHFRVLLRDLIDRIVEKRLDYYLPVEDLEEENK